MEEKSIVLVDDHELMRAGLAALLESLGNYKVILQCANGRELTKGLEGLGAPDLIVLDLRMPVMDGFETLEWLGVNRPELHTIVLTMEDKNDDLIQAVRKGARGYLLKDSSPQQFKLVIETVFSFGYAHSAKVQELLQNPAGFETAFEIEKRKWHEAISPREKEFLKHLVSASEPTYQKIADKMEIKLATVENFRNSICNKAGVKTKAGLALFAVKWELVHLKDLH